MSLQEMSKEVLSKALDKKTLIEKETQDNINTLEKESKERIDNFRFDLDKKFSNEKSHQVSKIVSKYNKLSEQEILEAKNLIRNKVYTQALEKILSMTKLDREKLYKKLIKLGKDLIKFDVILTSKSDLAFVKTLVSEKIRVKSQEELVGLILETSDGSEKVDLSFKNLFDEIYQSNEDEISKILF